MSNFDSLIESIHGGAIEDKEGYIYINEFRQFETDNFNTIIGYEGDINSQVVTFKCPSSWEGHNLTQCSYKKIKWKNLTSGIEGKNDLTPNDESTEENLQTLTWRVPADAFTKSGYLEISISLYDLTDQGQVVFQWNTASFSGLQIASTMNNVGAFQPADNEVLIISEETSEIMAPEGYNNSICNYGDVGVSTVYFRTKRYARGMDLLSLETKKVLGWKLPHEEILHSVDTLVITPYSANFDEQESNKEGLVNIRWEVSPDITCNPELYTGTFEIALSFSNKDKKWNTGSYSSLSINKSLCLVSNEPLPPVKDYYLINGDKIKGINSYTEVPGIQTLRTYTADETFLKRNELAVEYNANKDFSGLKIGTGGPNVVNIAPQDRIVYNGGEVVDWTRSQWSGNFNIVRERFLNPSKGIFVNSMSSKEFSRIPSMGEMYTFFYEDSDHRLCLGFAVAMGLVNEAGNLPFAFQDVWWIETTTKENDDGTTSEVKIIHSARQPSMEQWTIDYEDQTNGKVTLERGMLYYPIKSKSASTFDLRGQVEEEPRPQILEGLEW